MQNKLLAASFAVSVAIAVNARADGDWKEFKSEGGGFTVLLPGAPKEVVHRRPDNDWDLHEFNVQKGPHVFGVTYADIPEKKVAADGVDKLIDAERDSLIEATKSKIQQEKKAAINGNPGREISLDLDVVVLRVRFYLVKNRLYQVWAFVLKGKENDAEAVKMLDSFTLTGK